MGLNIIAKLSIVGAIGAVLCVAGAIFYAILPNVIETKIKENLKIVEGTPLYDSWRSPAVSIYMQFYFFNITNAEDVANNNSKPIVQQLGPYTFREYRKKVNITFDEDDTVSYEQYKWFEYEPEKSVGSLETDVVTTVNLPLTAMAQKTEGKLDIFKIMGLNSILREKKATSFVTRTVEELLYKGYQDEAFYKLNEMAKKELLPNNATFGFVADSNYSTDGVYNVFTGVKDQTKFMEIAKWNDNDHVNFWNDSYCNKINGTDGTIFPAPLKKDGTLYLFSTDLCRSIYLRYEETSSVYGIKTYRYTPPFTMFASGDIEPDNQCFCVEDGHCYKSGLLSISKCKQGVPVVLSPPHFYQSDDRYYNAIIGLNRNKFEHDTVLDVEPKTGLVLRAARKIQLNVHLKPMRHVSPMAKVPDILIPVFWVNESATIDENRAEQFKSRIIKPEQIGNAVSYALIGIGAFIVICAIIVITIKYGKSRAKDLPPSSSELKPVRPNVVST